MAVMKNPADPVLEFDDWYVRREVDSRDGGLRSPSINECASRYVREFEEFKREHELRVGNYYKYEIMADAEVVSKKPDLPNVSSGEIAGIVRRTARNVVQHTPNVEIISEHSESSPAGILARYVLKTKIIGDELNSNVMQQNLFASTISAFTLGFDAVVPVLMQKADKSWCMEYDSIHYRDVFPEPGIKDAQKSPVFYIRRYLTRGQLLQLIRTQPAGWDIAALRELAKSSAPAMQRESVSSQDAKHGRIPKGYEVVTWYSNSGDPFLTFNPTTKLLLRIEQNRDPLKRVPVQLLILERDPQQPLGKSQIALVFGRQEFQDLMLNGAMKLWYRNINPTLIGYGTGLNGAPNMSPGKYTGIPNPNAKIEAFEVSTQTLLQYGQISQQNQGSMISLIGAADQQMAAASNGGMSQTPQGVEAQQQMVDITTNNYQKAVEYFFSRYCSYALTLYFAEMKGIKAFKPSAEAREALLAAGMDPENFDDEGTLVGVDMKQMATVYNVRCVPGSLVELEDEKQLRVLNDLLVPISQAMPAFANTQNPELMADVVRAIQFIITKEIELSGSVHANELTALFSGTAEPTQLEQLGKRTEDHETRLSGLVAEVATNNEQNSSLLLQLQEQVSQLTAANSLLLEKLGVIPGGSAGSNVTPAAG